MIENAITKESLVQDDRETAFAEVYAITLNQSEAYRRAYNYAGPNAAQYGARVMRKEGVRKAINERLHERTMSADEVLARLTEHAEGDIATMLDDDGRVTLSKPEAKTRLIKKIRVRTLSHDDDEEVKDTEVELYDSQAALVHLGRHHKLFTDRIQIDDSQYKLYLDKLAQFIAQGAAPDVIEGESNEVIASDTGSPSISEGAVTPDAIDAGASQDAGSIDLAQQGIEISSNNDASIDLAQEALAAIEQEDSDNDMGIDLAQDGGK